MRKIITTTFVTLDGVMQAPGAPDEDRDGGFSHGGWSFGYWDDVMGGIMQGFMGRPFELLLGRRTYDIFAGRRLQRTRPSQNLSTVRESMSFPTPGLRCPGITRRWSRETLSASSGN